MEIMRMEEYLAEVEVDTLVLEEKKEVEVAVGLVMVEVMVVEVVDMEMEETCIMMVDMELVVDVYEIIGALVEMAVADYV